MGKNFWTGLIVGLLVGSFAVGSYSYVIVKAEREYSGKSADKINQNSSASLATTSATLADNADSVTQETHADMLSILADVFGETNLLSDTEVQAVQPNSLLIYSVPRMIVSDDIAAIRDQLALKGYENIEVGKQNIFAQKGQQSITNVSINSDLDDEGRFLIRVLVY